MPRICIDALHATKVMLWQLAGNHINTHVCMTLKPSVQVLGRCLTPSGPLILHFLLELRSGTPMSVDLSVSQLAVSAAVPGVVALVTNKHFSLRAPENSVTACDEDILIHTTLLSDGACAEL